MQGYDLRKVVSYVTYGCILILNQILYLLDVQYFVTSYKDFC